jgi:GNAT superfamily N-acetyltransferase
MSNKYPTTQETPVSAKRNRIDRAKRAIWHAIVTPPLEPERDSKAVRTPLPEGYYYADPQKVHSRKYQQLFLRDIGWEGATARDYRTRMKHWNKLGVSVADVAVGRQDGRLAGFGSIIYIGDTGSLCDFGVSTADRSNGIGKAIILDRLRIAEELGIRVLDIAALEGTNTLRTYYFDLGFQAVDDTTLVRGSDTPEFLEELATRLDR